jgi:C-terminal processing protease CtpA/Prc
VRRQCFRRPSALDKLGVVQKGKVMTNILSREMRFILLLTCLFCHSAVAQQPLSQEQYTSDFDYMWSSLRDNYAYFDEKETDWNKVRELYRPELANVRSKRDFIALLERVLDELYDNHSSLNTNLKTSPRLVPTGLDLWAEWRGGRAVITQVRSGFSAEQAGLGVGMEIVSVDGVPVAEAVSRRLPQSLKAVNINARNWALRAVLAGTHDRPRTIAAKNRRRSVTVYRLDLPTQTTVDNYRYEPRVDWRMLPGRIGYIKINDLISTDIVSQFDSALAGLRNSRGLLLDLRDIPKGGNTDVAEPIMGRLIERRTGYQQVVPLHEPAYIKEVAPRGDWTYKAPVVVLVNRWTASMGEGMSVGLDGMGRATVVGTRMAGLNGGVFNLQLPQTKIGITYAGERLNHTNGTPRENFVPPVLVNLMDSGLSRYHDPIFEVGYKKLNQLIRALPNSGRHPTTGMTAKNHSNDYRTRSYKRPLAKVQPEREGRVVAGRLIRGHDERVEVLAVEASTRAAVEGEGSVRRRA